MNKTKRILSLVVALMMVLTILPASLLASAADPLPPNAYTNATLYGWFGNNIGMLNAVRAAVPTPTSTEYLTKDELAGITTLNYVAANSSTALSSVPSTGFSYLTGLTNLTLTGHNFTSLSGLGTMNELTIVDVSNNAKLSDISTLYSAKKLTTLTANNCNISSLSMVNSHANLENAYLNNNKITSVSGFSTSTYRILKNLDLSNNQIKTISSDSYYALGNITSLKLGGNNLTKAEIDKVGLPVTSAMIDTQYIVTASGIPTTVSQPIIVSTSGVRIETVKFDNTASGKTKQEVLPVTTLSTLDTAIADVTQNSQGYYNIIPKTVGTFTMYANGNIQVANVSVSASQSSTIVINEKQNPNIGLNDQKLLSVTLNSGLVNTNAIEWVSSNPGILTVIPNSGNMSAIVRSYGLTGSATITAKLLDGSNRSDSITISVVNPVTAISFNSPKTSMQADETQNLSVTYSPSNATYKNVSYKSSNETVAIVSSSGVVTAKTPGTTTITATTTGNDYARSTYFTLTVTDSDLRIKLDKKDTKIYIDQELTVKATVSPTYLATGTVTWKSDDNSVASVDANGNIRGRKVGKATISARYSKDGETVGADINIEVINPSVKISLDDYSVTLTSDKIHTIDYKVTPSDLPNKKVTFTSSNEDVAAVTEEGVIIAGSAGKATITVKSDYNSKYVARVAVTVKPATPSLKVTRGTTSAKLTAGESDGATRYRYYAKSKSSDSYKRIADTTSKVFTATGLKSGQTYYFAVRSYYEVDGKNVYSDYKKVTSSVAPATPKFTYSKTNSSVTLKVSNPPAGSKYVYYMKYSSGESFFRISEGTTKTSFTERDLVKGETYYFTVRQYKTSDSKNVYSKYTTLKVKI